MGKLAISGPVNLGFQLSRGIAASSPFVFDDLEICERVLFQCFWRSTALRARTGGLLDRSALLDQLESRRSPLPEVGRAVFFFRAAAANQQAAVLAELKRAGCRRTGPCQHPERTVVYRSVFGVDHGDGNAAGAA